MHYFLDNALALKYIISMNRLTEEKQKQVVAALIEGNSIRATCRMTGVAKNTVVKLLADLGKACLEYQDKTLRNLPCKNIQCDEIWAFCYAKEKNVPEDKERPIWLWRCLDLYGFMRRHQIGAYLVYRQA